MDAEYKRTGGFKSQGEFFAAVKRHYNGDFSERIDSLRKAALNEGTDSQGGVVVPEQWAAPIYNAALEGSVVRSRANIVNMTSDRLNVPILVDSNRGTNLFGGVTLTWADEGADIYASTVKPAIGRCGLTAHKAVATCFVSNELDKDYDGLGSFLTKSFGEAVRFYEDDKFIWGTGSGQPLGVMNAPCLLSHNRSSGYAAAGSGDFGSMAGRFLPASWKNAVWLANPVNLATWAGNVTTTGANALGAIDLDGMRILGRPIVLTEHAATPGATGDIILADFSQYIIGDRGLFISASRDAVYSTTNGWPQDETCWKLVIRVDGQPLLPAAITPQRGGETLSSFVALSVSS